MIYNDDELLFYKEELKNIKYPFIEVFIPNLATPEYRDFTIKAINDFFSNENVKKVKYCIKIKQPPDGATDSEGLDFLAFLRFDLIKFYNSNGELSKIYYKGRIGYPLNRLNEIINKIPSATRVLFFIRKEGSKKEEPINVNLDNLIDTINYYKQDESIKINFCIENIGYYNGSYFYLKDKNLTIQPTDKTRFFKERYKNIESIKRDKIEIKTKDNKREIKTRKKIPF